jgi:hypothetical protein
VIAITETQAHEAIRTLTAALLRFHVAGCCPHHRQTLTSWRREWTHEPEDEFRERVESVRGQCCGGRDEPQL